MKYEYLLLFHCNNGWTNLSSLPVLFKIIVQLALKIFLKRLNSVRCSQRYLKYGQLHATSISAPESSVSTGSIRTWLYFSMGQRTENCGIWKHVDSNTITYNNFWCDFDSASSLICGNKIPTRCNTGFYCRSYCLLNIFRAPLCPSSGDQEYYTVVAASGISCCGFQVVGYVSGLQDAAE